MSASSQPRYDGLTRMDGVFSTLDSPDDTESALEDAKILESMGQMELVVEQMAQRVNDLESENQTLRQKLSILSRDSNPNPSYLLPSPHTRNGSHRQSLLPRLTQNEMFKILANNKWPKPEVYQSHDEYVSGIESHIVRLKRQNVDDEHIANNLHSELYSNSLASKYVIHCANADTRTTNDVLAALKACDKINGAIPKHRKFELLLPSSSDDESSYMQRLVTTYDACGSSHNPLTRRRAIIDQFCRGLNLPPSTADNLRHCHDFDDAVLIAVEDLRNLNPRKWNGNFQSPPKRFFQSRLFFNSNLSASQLPPLQQQLPDGGLPFEGQINSLEANWTSFGPHPTLSYVTPPPTQPSLSPVSSLSYCQGNGAPDSAE